MLMRPRRKEVTRLEAFSDGVFAFAAMWARHYAIFVLVGLFSIAVAASGLGLFYALPGWVYFLIGPLCYAHGVISERRRPVAAAHSREDRAETAGQSEEE